MNRKPTNGSENDSSPLKFNPFEVLKEKSASPEAGMNAIVNAGLLDTPTEDTVMPVAKPEVQVTAPAAETPATPVPAVVTPVPMKLRGSHLRTEERRLEKLVQDVLEGRHKPVLDPNGATCSIDPGKPVNGARNVVSADGNIFPISEDCANALSRKHGELTREQRALPEARLLIILNKENALNVRAMILEKKQKLLDAAEEKVRVERRWIERIRTWFDNPQSGITFDAELDFMSPVTMKYFSNLLTGQVDGEPAPKDECNLGARITHVVVIDKVTAADGAQGLRLAFVGDETVEALCKGEKPGEKLQVHALFTEERYPKFTLQGLKKAKEHFFPPAPVRKPEPPRQVQSDKRVQVKPPVQVPESSREGKPGAERHERRHKHDRKRNKPE